MTLLAPIASLDRSSPILDVGTLRIPVYTSRTINQSEIITDMSPYVVSIDPDITQDADNNGVYEDDFTMSGADIQVTQDQIIF